MKNSNATDKLFSWAVSFLILLIPCLVFLFVVFAPWEYPSALPWILTIFLGLPFIYITAIIIFFLLRFLINKIFPRKLRDYQIALIVSTIFFIWAFLFTDAGKMKLGKFTKNISLCKMIGSSDSRNKCIFEVAKFKKDETLCESVGPYFKDDCYFTLAQEKRDPNLCEKISEKDYVCELSKNGCYNKIAMLTEDPSVCERISELFAKNNCISKIALEKNEPELCEKLIGEVSYAPYALSNDCYKKIAIRYKNSTLCEKIKNNFSDINECYKKTLGYVPQR